jgi:hypothetical protein
MEPAMENAECRIVVTGDDDKLTIGDYGRVKPDEKSMCPHTGRCDVTREAAKCSTEVSA